MDYCIIAAIVVALLLMGAIWVFISNNRSTDSSDEDSKMETMVGGKENKKAKTKRAVVKKTSYAKHKSALTNVRHNEDAKFIFIYLGDLYPNGLKEGSSFKSVINQTKYGKEAYAVYERPCNGQWMDTLLVEEAWNDFETIYASTFEKEIMNGAKLVFIGKGLGAVYAKLFKFNAISTNLGFHRAIALNGITLRELIPALIMMKEGLDEISIGDIDFMTKKCMYKGKNYIDILGLNIYVYILMFFADAIDTNDYYNFYGTEGDGTIEVVPYNNVYENTYIIKTDKRFDIKDWLKRPKLLETVIKESI